MEFYHEHCNSRHHLNRKDAKKVTQDPFKTFHREDFQTQRQICILNISTARVYVCVCQGVTNGCLLGFTIQEVGLGKRTNKEAEFKINRQHFSSLAAPSTGVMPDEAILQGGND